MWNYFVTMLQDNPHIAVFFTLAVGYWIGNKRFGSFSLGAVTGTLVAGVVIGQLNIEVSGQVKSIFFIMFLFAVGFGVGPQFVRGIATDGAPQAGLCRCYKRALSPSSVRGRNSCRLRPGSRSGLVCRLADTFRIYRAGD